jgi:hypothetical protein
MLWATGLLQQWQYSSSSSRSSSCSHNTLQHTVQILIRTHCAVVLVVRIAYTLLTVHSKQHKQ